MASVHISDHPVKTYAIEQMPPWGVDYMMPNRSSQKHRNTQRDRGRARESETLRENGGLGRWVCLCVCVEGARGSAASRRRTKKSGKMHIAVHTVPSCLHVSWWSLVAKRRKGLTVHKPATKQTQRATCKKKKTRCCQVMPHTHTHTCMPATSLAAAASVQATNRLSLTGEEENRTSCAAFTWV